MPFFRLAQICAKLTRTVIALLLGLFLWSPYFAKADLDHWTWGSPQPQGNSLAGVGYGNGNFVAVGQVGTILTSTNGTEWALRASGCGDDLNGLACNGRLFVAVGQSGAILSSANAVQWTNQPAVTANDLSAVLSANGAFVVCGQGGTILTSTDGLKWTARLSGVTNDLQGLAYGKGIFIAVGSSGMVLVSSNAVKWVHSTIGAGDFSGVAFGKGKFVAVEGNRFWTSSDGLTWVIDPLESSVSLSCITWADNQYIAVGTDGGGSGRDAIWNSGDGVTWTNQTPGSTNDFPNGFYGNQLRSLAFGNGIGVAVGKNGAILSARKSGDGSYQWNYAALAGNHSFEGVAFWAGNFLNASTTGADNGENWTNRFGAGKGFWSICSGYGLLIAVGSDGMIETSADAVQWTNQTSGVTNALFGVAFANDGVAQGTYVAVGQAGKILASADAQNWSPVDSGTSNAFFGVTYANGTFVAVGELGTILTSTTGTNWATQLSPSENALFSVTYGNGLFVAVGAEGTLLTSADSTNWQAVVSGTSCDLYGVVYGKDQFVCVGQAGTILSSTNGITWNQRFSGTRNQLYGIAYGNLAFAVVGEAGTMIIATVGPPILPIAPNNVNNVLPSAIVGVGYTNFLQATGGSWPYTWSLVSNTLPAGLKLDTNHGVIFGNPTVAGMAIFRLRVTGSDGFYSQGDFILQVSPAGATNVFPTTASGMAIGLSVASDGQNFLAAVRGDGTNSAAICGQLISSDGQLINADIRTGRTSPAFIEGTPVVAFGGGNYLMVWEDDGLGVFGGTNQIYGQLVSTSGAPVGTAFPVASCAALQQWPCLAFDGDNYLVVWLDWRDGVGELYGKFISPDGAMLSDALPLVQELVSVQFPAVAFDGEGYLLTWISQLPYGAQGVYNVKAETVSKSGDVGTASLIGTTTQPESKSKPITLSFGTNSFLVVWKQDATVSNQSYTVTGRFVSTSGEPLENKFPIATATGTTGPQVAFDGHNYLVSWSQGKSAPTNVVCRYMTCAGDWFGIEFSPFAKQGTNVPMFCSVAASSSGLGLVGTLGTMDASSQGFTSGNIYFALLQQSLVKDSLPPVLTVTNYCNWQAVATSTITLCGTASDAGRGDNGVTFVKVNSARASGDSVVGTGIAQWNKKISLKTGTNIITIVAADGAGNLATNSLHMLCDMASPVVTLLTPKSNLRVTDLTITAQGTLQDGFPGAKLMWQLNNGGWNAIENAQTWTVDCPLTPGTNWFQVYGQDAAGNLSRTQQVSIFRIVTALLSVRNGGHGAISSNYDGQLLEIGRGYSMTAVGQPGYALGTWVLSTGDGVTLTNSDSCLRFIMQSNLVITANFVDSQRPVLSILFPAQHSKFTASQVSVSGTASDNIAVDQVVYQLNGGDWIPADTANGWANWTASITAAPGPNTLRVVARDTDGNSTTNNLQFSYTVTSPITLITNGSGTIQRKFSIYLLEVGQSYTVRAIPGNNSVFLKWTGTMADSTNNPLTFVMQSNMVVQANFVTNPFVALYGSYYGLFVSGENQLVTNTGEVILTLTKSGRYSGRVLLYNETHNFTGAFDVLLHSEKTLPRRTSSLHLTMTLSPADSMISGIVDDSAWIAQLRCGRSTSATTNVGTYTFLAQATNSESNLPQGISEATIVVRKDASLKISGHLADGTPFTQSTMLDSFGQWPLYLRCYNGQGVAANWLGLDTAAPIFWGKLPVHSSRYYPAGFAETMTAVTAQYIPPTKTAQLDWTNTVLILGEGNLPTPLTNVLSVSKNQFHVISGTASGLVLNYQTRDGRLMGSFVHPLTHRVTLFSTHVLENSLGQYPVSSGGWFLGTNQSGYVYFQRQ